MDYAGNLLETPEVYRGETRGASNLPLNIHSNALGKGLVVKPGQAILYGFTVLNTNASAQFILVFDASTLPANGIVPAVSFTVAGANQLGVNWIPGRTFRQGIVIANSSTADTLTIGSADCFFDAQYVWMPIVSVTPVDPGAAVDSVFTRTGAVVATSGDYTVAQVTGAAPLASPTFTGTPAAPTAAGGTSTTQLATTAFVASSFAPIASPTFTGTVTVPAAVAVTAAARLNQLSPVATVVSGALATVQLVSGTGVQIVTTRDVDTYTAITYNSLVATNATATIALSPDNVTYSTLAVITKPVGVAFAGEIGMEKVRVPAGWYLKITVAQAVLGLTTFC